MVLESLERFTGGGKGARNELSLKKLTTRYCKSAHVLSAPECPRRKKEMAAPSRQIKEPVRSQVSGRCLSTAQSQRTEAAMYTPP